MLKIDKNIPIPECESVSKFPLEQMDIGDSFEMDIGDRAKFAHAKKMLQKKFPDRDFITRKSSADQVRVWRVA